MLIMYFTESSLHLIINLLQRWHPSADNSAVTGYLCQPMFAAEQ